MQAIIVTTISGITTKEVVEPVCDVQIEGEVLSFSDEYGERHKVKMNGHHEVLFR